MTAEEARAALTPQQVDGKFSNGYQSFDHLKSLISNEFQWLSITSLFLRLSSSLQHL